MVKSDRTGLWVCRAARKCQVGQPNNSRFSGTVTCNEAAVAKEAQATRYLSVSPTRNGMAISFANGATGADFADALLDLPSDAGWGAKADLTVAGNVASSSPMP